MASVFISYARSDRDKAQAIAGALHDRGHDPWWDHDLASGEDFTEVIEQRLSEVDAVIVLWTQASVDRGWVLGEAAIGLERDCLMPVHFDRNVKPPKAFGQVNSQYLGDWSGLSTAAEIDVLVGRLGELRARRDRERLSGAMPESLRKRLERTGVTPALAGASLPGGLRLWRLAIGAILCALVVWAVLVVLQAMPDADVLAPADAGLFCSLAFLIMAARALDQVVAAHKHMGTDRFLSRSFSFASAVSVLASAACALVLYLIDPDGDHGGLPRIAQGVVLFAVYALVVAYVVRAGVTTARFVHSRL